MFSAATGLDTLVALHPGLTLGHWMQSRLGSKPKFSPHLLTIAWWTNALPLNVSRMSDFFTRASAHLCRSCLTDEIGEDCDELEPAGQATQWVGDCAGQIGK